MKFLIFLIFLIFPFYVSAQCGNYRWDIKTMSDRSGMDTAYTFAPIEFLTIIPRPKIYRSTRYRAWEETKVYTIEGTITYWKIEKDYDIHIVLKSLDSDSTIVCEIPNRKCAQHSKVLGKIIKARKDFFKYIKPNKQVMPGIYEITGALFFDQTMVYGKPHNVIGHAYNWAELHPVIKFIKIK